ncbi:MAG: DUF5666 domain-containing protein, partial [Nitrospiria bacterium]
MKNVFKRIFPLMLVALLTASCGGGSGGNQTASGGIGGTGISQGSVTGFGSVILNGVKFNTDNATFTVDDKPGTQANLAVGMQVKIRVGEDGITAETVEFEPEVEGPVENINFATNTLTVLGRTVVRDDNTKIEDTAGNPVPFNTLTPGVAVLEISGLVFSDDKVVQATHIRLRDDAFAAGTTEVEIKGKIASLDTTPNTFVIGTQLINYSGITPAPSLNDGDFVEVKGKHDGVSTLTAESIEQEDAFSANAGDKVEIEGVVDAPFTGIASFSINGQAVTTDGTTVFEDGAPDDVAANVRLEVEGTITGGVLVAKKVQFRGNRIKIEATVESKSTSGANIVTLLGIPVVINGATEMKDGIDFSNINPPDPLAIKGYLTGTGTSRMVVATRVEAN